MKFEFHPVILIEARPDLEFDMAYQAWNMLCYGCINDCMGNEECDTFTFIKNRLAGVLD